MEEKSKSLNEADTVLIIEDNAVNAALLADIFDKDYRIDVSKRLHEDYGNGKDYYKYHGEKLLILPEKQIELPSKEYLEWHNEHVFLG